MAAAARGASRSSIRRCSTPPIAAEVPDFDTGPLPAGRVDRHARSVFAARARGRPRSDRRRALVIDDSSSAIAPACRSAPGVGGAGTQDVLYRRYYAEKIPRAASVFDPANDEQRRRLAGRHDVSACAARASASRRRARRRGHSIGEAFEMIRGGTRRRDARRRRRRAGHRAGDRRSGKRCACSPIPPIRRPRAGRSAATARASSSAKAPGCWCSKTGIAPSLRGARIHAELVGYGATSDAAHITQPGIDAPVARDPDRARSRRGSTPDDVQYVNAHGTGTPLNDSTETAIIKKAFGAHASRLAVSSTKSMHGHAMGASGAIELVATILAMTARHRRRRRSTTPSRSGLRSRLRAEHRAGAADRCRALELIRLRRPQRGPRRPPGT